MYLAYKSKTKAIYVCHETRVSALGKKERKILWIDGEYHDVRWVNEEKKWEDKLK
jgi:hypothetical protein